MQDGVAVVAVQLLGQAHPGTTTVTGSVTVESDNVIDVVELTPCSAGPGTRFNQRRHLRLANRHRRRLLQVYDAEIGTPPAYAGRRQRCLIMRFR